MLINYSKLSLENLSQGERISYIRQPRMMSQDKVSNKLGLKDECKRKTFDFDTLEEILTSLNPIQKERF